MRAALDRPGIDYNFSQPIKDRVEESISGIRGQVVVKIYGDDLSLMHGKLDEVEAIIERHARRARRRRLPRRQRAAHRRRHRSRGDGALRRAGARRRGRGGGRLRRRAGDELWEGERRVGVRVKLPVADEGDAASRRAAGGAGPRTTRGVPLAALAKLHLDSGRTQINREQGRRFLAIKCNVEGRDMGSFVAEAQARVAARGEAARGLLPDLGRRVREPAPGDGAAGGDRAAVGDAISACSTWRSARRCRRWSCCWSSRSRSVGGVFALWVTRTELSVSSAVGFITLFGVVGDGRRAARQLHAARAGGARARAASSVLARGVASGCGRC